MSRESNAPRTASAVSRHPSGCRSGRAPRELASASLPASAGLQDVPRIRRARVHMISNISSSPREAALDASAIAGREAGLHKDLSRAQLVMIVLGGAIGTGLFMGSGVALRH